MSRQTPSSPPTGPRIAPVYQLKLTLLEVERPVWPRIKVSGGLTLERLHTVMLKAMGWQNAHLEARGYDFKAVNPHAKNTEDTRTPEELLDVIDAKGREVADAIAALRKML